MPNLSETFLVLGPHILFLPAEISISNQLSKSSRWNWGFNSMDNHSESNQGLQVSTPSFCNWSNRSWGMLYESIFWSYTKPLAKLSSHFCMNIPFSKLDPHQWWCFLWRPQSLHFTKTYTPGCDDPFLPILPPWWWKSRESNRRRKLGWHNPSRDLAVFRHTKHSVKLTWKI